MVWYHRIESELNHRNNYCEENVIVWVERIFLFLIKRETFTWPKLNRQKYRYNIYQIRSTVIECNSIQYYILLLKCNIIFYYWNAILYFIIVKFSNYSFIILIDIPWKSRVILDSNCFSRGSIRYDIKLCSISIFGEQYRPIYIKLSIWTGKRKYKVKWYQI